MINNAGLWVKGKHNSSAHLPIHAPALLHTHISWSGPCKAALLKNCEKKEKGSGTKPNSWELDQHITGASMQDVVYAVEVGKTSRLPNPGQDCQQTVRMACMALWTHWQCFRQTAQALCP